MSAGDNRTGGAGGPRPPVSVRSIYARWRAKSLGVRWRVLYCQDVTGTPEITWLAECSPVALGEALRVVAPELSGYPLTVPGLAGKQDPLWHSGSVPVGDRFFVKFAWSRPAALQLAREIAVLAALARGPAVPFLPEVVASSTSPLLLITRRVPGASLFEVAGSITRTARPGSSCGSWPPCITRPPASASRPPSAQSPARCCRPL